MVMFPQSCSATISLSYTPWTLINTKENQGVLIYIYLAVDIMWNTYNSGHKQGPVGVSRGVLCVRVPWRKRKNKKHLWAAWVGVNTLLVKGEITTFHKTCFHLVHITDLYLWDASDPVTVLQSNIASYSLG